MNQIDLLAYIRSETQNGMSADALRQELLQAGWRELDIENALHDVAAGLHPVTAGASIHEDLAQVRGVVAHLASRVHQLESRLTTAGALPMLPELPEGHHSSGVFGFMMTLATFVGAFAFGAGVAYVTAGGSTLPLIPITGSAAAALLLLVCAISAMHRHAAVVASALCAAAITIWGFDVWVAWHQYHAIELQTTVALGVLLTVLAFVMGRWIDRYQTS